MWLRLSMQLRKASQYGLDMTIVCFCDTPSISIPQVIQYSAMISIIFPIIQLYNSAPWSGTKFLTSMTPQNVEHRKRRSQNSGVALLDQWDTFPIDIANNFAALRTQQEDPYSAYYEKLSEMFPMEGRVLVPRLGGGAGLEHVISRIRTFALFFFFSPCMVTDSWIVHSGYWTKIYA